MKTICENNLQLCYKETPTQVFSYEYFKNVKNAYFEEHLRMVASVRFYEQDSQDTNNNKIYA